jgi:hypothetical protein
VLTTSPREPSARSRTYAGATWLFLRVLGLVYLAAFWSLGVQVVSLSGRTGILPAAAYLTNVRTMLGAQRFWLLPTLSWVSDSDAFLRLLCVGGSVLSLTLLAGLLPLLVLPLLWIVYLSVSIAGRDFLSYQWDALLLETGFLAIFLAPAVVRERWRDSRPPSRAAVWLMLWLLFRLMFGSGVVKLTSHDPTWRGLTALAFHFETQPIPTPLAWYAAKLPVWCLETLTALTLGLEIGAPFLIVGPRRLRVAAFCLLAGLQLLIALTGNYAFFNLLTVALCLFLLDDVTLGRLIPPRSATVQTGRLRRWCLVAVAVVTLPVSTLALAGELGLSIPGAPIVEPLATLVAPFRSINSYGLFAVMTTTRPEIIVEGSDDGTNWMEYGFPYKVGDLHRRPPWVAPHQPRLDWQMWFAALGRFDDERWFQNFCVRLLEADPSVLRLLERDPFQGRRPKYLRATLYRYKFSDWETRRRDGVWWTRERLGAYSPVLSLNASPR